MNRYVFNTKRIGAELINIIHYWGYNTFSNISDYSNSVYIKILAGTRAHPRAIHIRVADHGSNGGSSMFNYDVAASFSRNGAITYPKLIHRLAAYLGKPIPRRYCKLLEQDSYKAYAIRLQENRRRVRR